jgi:serine/threonine-protein kinase
VSAVRGDGRYQLVSRIATGGMGEVWRAEDTVLDREVAVKLLKTEYADDPVFRTRFQAEARHAAGLNHPNIASVFDVGELADEDGAGAAADGSGTRRPFLVMELVPGQPLSELLRGGEPLHPKQAADIAAQVADGLAAAHAMGIVHRDVKPANLLVAPTGHVKITDFGIARAVDTGSVTQTGQIIGTPHYISPEQAEGAPASAASDLYALGVVLYECLAGRRPFDRDTPIQVALAHLHEPVPPLDPQVPGWLRQVVESALAKRPEDRPASAAELAAALRGGPGSSSAVAAASAPDATQVLPAAAAAAPVAGPAAAAAAPVAGLSGHAGRGGHRQAGTAFPRWWPWAAAGAVVLALVVATAAFAGVGDSSPAAADSPPTGSDGTADGAAPVATTPSPRRSSREGTTKPTASSVPVREASLVGRDHKDVKRQLEAMGLRVHEQKVAATSPDQDKGTVAWVDPAGDVPPGSTVTIGVHEKHKPANDWDDWDDWDDREDREDREDDHGERDHDEQGHGKGEGRGEGDDD